MNENGFNVSLTSQYAYAPVASPQVKSTNYSLPQHKLQASELSILHLSYFSVYLLVSSAWSWVATSLLPPKFSPARTASPLLNQGLT